MVRRLELACGVMEPAKVGWPVVSVVREVRFARALAKVGLEVGRPPKRAVWSMVFAAVTWAAKVLPMVERDGVGR